MEKNPSEATHLIRTSNDPRKMFASFLSSFRHRLQDGGVIGAQIDKNMSDAILSLSSVKELVVQVGFDTPPTGPQKRQMMQCRPYSQVSQHDPRVVPVILYCLLAHIAVYQEVLVPR